ncbi:unnamed protein product [Lepidochelys olivacea]
MIISAFSVFRIQLTLKSFKRIGKGASGTSIVIFNNSWNIGPGLWRHCSACSGSRGDPSSRSLGWASCAKQPFPAIPMKLRTAAVLSHRLPQGKGTTAPSISPASACL